MRNLLIAAAAAFLPSCAPSPVPDLTDPRSRLGSQLAGHVAGRPLDCISHDGAAKVLIVQPDAVLFPHGDTIYMNRLQGGCGDLGSGRYRLSGKPHAGKLCRGDSAQAADIHTFAVMGACTMGVFVPYTKAAG